MTSCDTMWYEKVTVPKDRSVINSLPQEIYPSGVQLPAYVDKLVLKFNLAGDLFSDPLDLNLKLKMRIVGGNGEVLKYVFLTVCHAA